MFRTLLITVTVDKQMEIFLDEKNLIILRNKQPEIVMQQRKKIWIYQIQGRILSENSQIKWNGSLALPRPSYKQTTVTSFWKKMGAVKQWSSANGRLLGQDLARTEDYGLWAWRPGLDGERTLFFYNLKNLKNEEEIYEDLASDSFL